VDSIDNIEKNKLNVNDRAASFETVNHQRGIGYLSAPYISLRPINDSVLFPMMLEELTERFLQRQQWLQSNYLYCPKVMRFPLS
jgi:hypothetical protein